MDNHDSSKNIKVAFFLNLGFTIFEFIGGYFTNSVAIMADAVHDLGDSLALGLSWTLDKNLSRLVTVHSLLDTTDSPF